jgi:hypothetical protein
LALVSVPAFALAASSPTQSAAEKQCRQERTQMGVALFKATYGTNKNHSNAFGKCVSHRTRQDTADQKAAHTNAAKQCKAEENDPNFAATHNGKTFAQFYGTGKSGHNGYGKCVSSKAKAIAANSERQQVKAEVNAARQCRSERAADPAAFKAKYGTNHNKSNAFGKCVSAKAKAQGH